MERIQVRLSRKLEHLVALLRSQSLMGLARQVVYRAYEYDLPFSVFDVYLFGHRGPCRYSASLPSTLRLSLASSDELPKILECAPQKHREHLRRLFEGFFAQGHRCAVAGSGEAIIGFLWAFTETYTLTLDDYRERSLKILIPTGGVFTGNAYVAPHQRQRGVFRALKTFLLQQYPEETVFYTEVQAVNLASLKVNRELGFTPFAVLRFKARRNVVAIRSSQASSSVVLRKPWPALRVDGLTVRPWQGNSSQY
jgi:hypothetical protein